MLIKIPNCIKTYNSSISIIQQKSLLGNIQSKLFIILYINIFNLHTWSFLFLLLSISMLFRMFFYLLRNNLKNHLIDMNLQKQLFRLQNYLSDSIHKHFIKNILIYFLKFIFFIIRNTTTYQLFIQHNKNIRNSNNQINFYLCFNLQLQT